VVARCRTDVARFERDVCDRAPTPEKRAQCEADIEPCKNGGEICKFLACIDASLGNISDGRIRMEGK
jgi:5'-nucleotidase